MKDVAVGKTLLVQTKNTLYTIRKTGEESYTIEGSARFCPIPTECNIHGSTWGGSMLKVNFIGRGMRMEFSTKIHHTITTTTIQEVTEQ